MLAVTPAVLLPPTTLMALIPLAPPTAPPKRLPLPSTNVPVFAVLVVRAPVSVVLGARLIVPSAPKIVAALSVDNPLLKFTPPVPLTCSVVEKTGPSKFTTVPALPVVVMSRKTGVDPPRAPNTFELLLNRILLILAPLLETAT